MATLKPLSNRVVVKRSKQQTRKGGIILPDSAQEKPKEGEVISVGPGKTNEDGSSEPMTVKIGDCVLFGAYAGTEVTNNDEPVLIMSEDDILGIVS